MKHVFALLTLTLSLSTLALPATTSALLEAFSEKKMLQDMFQNYRMMSDSNRAFDMISYSVERIPMSDKVREVCNMNGRSAAALEVTFRFRDGTEYRTVFATPYAPADLKSCAPTYHPLVCIN